MYKHSQFPPFAIARRTGHPRIADASKIKGLGDPPKIVDWMEHMADKQLPSVSGHPFDSPHNENRVCVGHVPKPDLLRFRNEVNSRHLTCTRRPSCELCAADEAERESPFSKAIRWEPQFQILETSNLSNLIFAPADEQILELCRAQSVTYSRYADDMTFSCTTPLGPSFLNGLRTLLHEHGYRLNEKKTRFARPGQAKFVTGFVVNERVQAPRELRRKLRAMFHRARLDPTRYAEKSNELSGWASFVNAYDPKLGRTYLRIASRVRRLSA